MNSIQSEVVRALLQESSVSEKIQAIRTIAQSHLAAVWELRDFDMTIPILLDLSQNDAPAVRQSAIESLSHLAENTIITQILDALGDSNAQTQVSIVKILASINVSISAKIEHLLSSEIAEVRAAAASVVGELQQPEISNKLLHLFQDSDVEVQINAIKSLGTLRKAGAGASLRKYLTHPDVRLRQVAAEALGQIGDLTALDDLYRVAHQDEDSDVRFWCLYAQALMGDVRSLDLLIPELQSVHSWRRMRAVNALGYVNDERAIQAIVGALQDEHPRVRRFAAESLGRLRSNEAVESLVNALFDKSSNVRGYAAWALGQIGEVRAIDALSKLIGDSSIVSEMPSYPQVKAVAIAAIHHIHSR